MTEDSGWKFSQCFGDKGISEEVTEADLISAVEFDETGKYLATGDKGGRVVLFEREDPKKGHYKFWTEFQSHEPEFDYLKSLEIEEKVNKIRWCKKKSNAHFLLTTNDKTIKLWKVFEKNIRTISSISESKEKISFPKVTVKERINAHVPKKVFANAHAYHINSISTNSDSETFLSADDLRINLWNYEISDQCFNIVDIKPNNMEELSEVITAAEFHPSHCHLFMYSTSKGLIKIADMRKQALCDTHSKVFEEEEDPNSKSFFSEILSSISDIKFSRDGRYILSRDFLTLKLWDINMEKKPIKTFNIHDHLKTKLCDLYENDCIFDKFECGFSGDGNQVVTGSYSNAFRLFDKNTKADVLLEASKSGSTLKKQTKSKSIIGRKKKDDVNVDSIDFTKKILHLSWHPTENTIAVAATNNLYIFNQNETK